MEPFRYPAVVINKIFNDPVHGFIEVSNPLLLELIDHRYFQRLRRIRQLALTSLVYPGANHSRFNHALGAMFLTRQAIDVLKTKGVPITEAEEEATLIAILLHDIGHGPFSHALEKVLVLETSHEKISLELMQQLNVEFEGKLDLALRIFQGNHPKKFLHQLVSGQLDMDRLDYLQRDSFFTGVVEGIVGADRIIKTLNVEDSSLVVESKGIYSVENFIIARRLMYWQVYLHKAVIASEYMLVHILKRARLLFEAGQDIFTGPELGYFFTAKKDRNEADILKHFVALDDEDIWYSIKRWQNHSDKVLSDLCSRLLDRKLLKIQISKEPFDTKELDMIRKQVAVAFAISEEEAAYYVYDGSVSNLAYLNQTGQPIGIRFRDGKVVDIAQASDMENIAALSEPVVKYFISFPEGFRIRD